VFELIQIIDKSTKVNSANVSDTISCDIYIAFLWNAQSTTALKMDIYQRKCPTVILLDLESLFPRWASLGLRIMRRILWMRTRWP
jgi:hypothetical protein